MFGKIDDLRKLLGDFDVGKAKDTVDALWDDREKITETVNLVWDNRDAITEAIEFVDENKDAIIGLIKELPGLLNKTGGGIAMAGESAEAASAFLLGDDGDQVAIADITELAADAISRCVEQLGNAADVIAEIGNEVDEISIPTVEPVYTEVAGFRVVTGLDFGSAGIVDKAADRMRSGAGNLSAIAEDFGVVSNQLKQLGSRLTETGGDLHNVGGLLRETGATLQELTEPG